jgi:hypothetical protein
MEIVQKRRFFIANYDKWFCEEHRSPKFPYFVDWDTVLDVHGDPQIKALYYTEYKREGGHPDFNYWRKTFEAQDIAEKELDRLIKIGLDKMNAAIKEREYQRAQERYHQAQLKAEKERITGQTETRVGFVVPLEVYSNAEYQEYLDHADNMKSVKVIVDEYYRKYGKRENLEKPNKKKHWWQ